MIATSKLAPCVATSARVCCATSRSHAQERLRHLHQRGSALHGPLAQKRLVARFQPTSDSRMTKREAELAVRQKYLTNFWCELSAADCVHGADETRTARSCACTWASGCGAQLDVRVAQVCGRLLWDGCGGAHTSHQASGHRGVHVAVTTKRQGALRDQHAATLRVSHHRRWRKL